jgi:hypothetical protein
MFARRQSEKEVGLSKIGIDLVFELMSYLKAVSTLCLHLCSW